MAIHDQVLFFANFNANAPRTDLVSGAPFLISGTLNTVAGRFDNAIEPTGVASYGWAIDAPNRELGPAGSFSLAVWVYLGAIPGSMATTPADIIRYGTATVNGYWIEAAAGGLIRAGYIDLATSTYQVSTSLTVLNTWIHLCLVYDQAGSTLTLYQDGIVVGSIPATGTLKEAEGSTLLFGRGYTGRLDSVVVWGKALTVSEIAALQSADLVLPTASPDLLTGLRLALPFDAPWLTQDPAGGLSPLTIVGSATYEPGIFGNCLVFDGASSATKPDRPRRQLNVDPLTLSCWVRFDVPLSAMTKPVRVVSYGDLTTDGYYLVSRGAGSTITFGLVDTAGSVYEVSVDDTTVGEWVHYLGTYNKVTEQVTLYRNGIPAGAVLASGTVKHISGQNLIIGQNLQGAIDEVGLWNTTLSAEAIAFLAGNPLQWTDNASNPINVSVLAEITFDHPYLQHETYSDAIVPEGPPLLESVAYATAPLSVQFSDSPARVREIPGHPLPEWEMSVIYDYDTKQIQASASYGAVDTGITTFWEVEVQPNKAYLRVDEVVGDFVPSGSARKLDPMIFEPSTGIDLGGKRIRFVIEAQPYEWATEWQTIPGTTVLPPDPPPSSPYPLEVSVNIFVADGKPIPQRYVVGRLPDITGNSYDYSWSAVDDDAPEIEDRERAQLILLNLRLGRFRYSLTVQVDGETHRQTFTVFVTKNRNQRGDQAS